METETAVMRLEARERQEFLAPTRSEGRRAWSRRNRTCGRNQAHQHLDFWLMATRTVREYVLLSSAPSALRVLSYSSQMLLVLPAGTQQHISLPIYPRRANVFVCRHSLGALAWVSTFEFLIYFVCTADIVGFLPVCPSTLTHPWLISAATITLLESSLWLWGPAWFARGTESKLSGDALQPGIDESR